MFSKMSVRVQPFAPQSEYAGVPDALIVLASLIICDHVFGGWTPACLRTLTLYQRVDLLDALKRSA